MSDKPIDVVRRYVDGMEAGLEECMAEMSDDIHLISPCVPEPVPKEFRGIASVRAVFEILFTTLFKEFRWTRKEIYATDDPSVVVALLTSNVILRNDRPYTLLWA